MIRLLLVLASCALLGSGCSVLSRKPKPPKENPAIASETEAIFRERWIERRVGQLTAQGVAASAAREQAANEFRQQFGFNEPAPKKK